MRKAKVLGALVLAGTLVSPTFADDFSGIRLGMHISSEKLEGTFDGGAFGTAETNADRFGYGIFGGWAMNRYLAFEAGINSGTEFSQDIPEFAAQVSALPTPPDNINDPPYFRVRNDVKSFETSAVGSWWVNKNFSLFGRLGFYGWKAETTVSAGDPDSITVKDQADDTGFAPLFGLGLQTQLDGALIRAEYRFADVGDLSFGNGFSQEDNQITSLTVSIVWVLR